MTFFRAAAFLALLSCGAFAQTAVITSPLTVQATSTTGTSFTYSGTLTQASTLGISVSGAACEQGLAYCTNASGVLVVAGSSPVGATTSFTGTFGVTTGTWNYGALLMTISGVGTVQIFPANAANGLGSATPPGTLTLNPIALSALGFGSFSVVNPTITFIVADTLYTDNSGTFTLTPVSNIPGTPAPSTFWLTLAGMATLAAFFYFVNPRLMERRAR
jgi:hypothetical protein